MGPDHASTADTLNNIGEVHRHKGNYDEALSLYDRALKIKEKALGPDHPSTLDTLYNMALLHKGQGDNVKAKEVLDKCLDGHILKPIWTRASTPSTPSTLTQTSHEKQNKHLPASMTARASTNVRA